MFPNTTHRSLWHVFGSYLQKDKKTFASNNNMYSFMFACILQAPNKVDI